MKARFVITEYDGFGGLRAPVYFKHLEEVIDYLSGKDLSQFEIEERVDISKKIRAYISADAN